jgi:hypothetical protein
MQQLLDSLEMPISRSISLKVVPKGDTNGDNSISQLVDTNICLVALSNCQLT